MNKVYKLLWDYTHSGDPEKDAFHVPFEHANMASTLFINPKYTEKLPSKILFQADFSLIPLYDYPLTDLRIPVMSDKMINILTSIAMFDYFAVPVIMFDYTCLGDRFDDNGELLPIIPTCHTYKAILLQDRQYSVFDYENSIYKTSLVSSKPGYIKKLVLKDMQEGFPALFRIPESPSTIFISGEAKEALVKNNIKGCVFEEVELSIC